MVYEKLEKLHNIQNVNNFKNMPKSEIHPKWFNDATVYCDGKPLCTVGSTKEKLKVDIESIEVSVPKTLESDRVAINPVRTGTVSFFDTSKGFGFIVDGENQEKYFCHVSGLIDEITEGNRVSFELEKGMKGMNAVKVTIVK